MTEEKTLIIMGMESTDPESPSKIKDTTTAKTFGDWAYIAIAKHYKKIAKYEQDVLKDKDPEDLHQMRVGMRRLRSAMIGFSSALQLPKNATEKKVGKVARILGELRDLDVLQETLEMVYFPSLPSQEKKLLNLALDELKKQRKKALKKVKAVLTDSSYCYLKKDLETWLNSPNYNPIASLDIYTILPDLLLPQISQFLLHQGWLVGENNQNSLSVLEIESLLNQKGKQLHDLRKTAKKTRYNMELFNQFYNETYHHYLQLIKDIQTVLGDIQDSFVLSEFLFNTLDFDVLKKMPDLTEQLRQKRAKKWEEWQKLREVFLKIDNRKEFREVILNPLVSPVDI